MPTIHISNLNSYFRNIFKEFTQLDIQNNKTLILIIYDATSNVVPKADVLTVNINWEIITCRWTVRLLQYIV